MVLANAGLLKGVEATVYETPESVSLLKHGGAIYKNQDLVVQDKIITANGPHAASAFGNAILTILT